MKRFLLLILLLSVAGATFSQETDFIVLKKRNNRTIKTFYPGIFISAVTYNGFAINGYIKAIRNDSIIIQQQETRLTPTEFGSSVDTLKYTIGIDYHEIQQFNYSKQYTWGHKKGFVEVSLPRIMMIGGAGYIILELVNGTYRGESISSNNKLPSLVIAAGIAIAGFLWTELQTHNNKAGNKYKVVYVRIGHNAPPAKTN